MELFRPEVMAHKTDTWLSELVAARPLSNRFLGLMLVAVGLIVLAYLCIGERTRRAAISGYIVPAEGLIQVLSQQPGTITAMKVKEGQFVRRGTVLAVMSFERRTAEGGLRHRIAESLAQRRRSMEAQRRSSDDSFAQQARLGRHRIEQYRHDLTTLDQSIRVHNERLALMRDMVESEGKLAHEGYVGKADLLESKMRLMEQENRLRELERAKLALERELIDARIALQALPVRALEARSELIRAEDDIARQQIENEDRRENLLIAPVDGTVTAIQKGVGKFVASGQPVLSQVPLGADLTAHFYVTSDAIGFLRTGSEARLQFIAFPYQKYGSYKGSVVSVSKTAVPADELPFPVPGVSAGENDMVYIVQIKPDYAFVTAYGKKVPLRQACGSMQRLGRPAPPHRMALRAAVQSVGSCLVSGPCCRRHPDHARYAPV